MKLQKKRKIQMLWKGANVPHKWCLILNELVKKQNNLLS